MTFRTRLILSGTIAAFIAGAAIWLMTMHGTTGMVKYNPGVLVILILMLLAAVATPLLAVIKSRDKGLGRFLKTAWWTMAAGSTIVSLTTFGVFGLSPFTNGGDKLPTLILTQTPAHPAPYITLSFWTSARSRNTLQWGGEGHSETITEPDSRQRHAFTLSSLKPGGRYWYQVNGQAAVEFRMPPAGPPIRLAIGSDSHYGTNTSRPDLTRRLLEQIKANNYDFFLHLGDLAQFGWMDSNWTDGMADLSVVTTRTPVRMAPGNHDTMLGGWNFYQEYSNPATPAPPWTRLDFGTVHLIMLDLEWLSEAMTPTQLAWLEGELAGIPRQDWCLVAAHGFVFSSGTAVAGWLIGDNIDLIRTLAPLFEKYDVDIVFSGHSHHLEWLQAGGVDYIICGAFGGIPDGPRTYTSPASRWFQTGASAYLDVIIGKDKGTVIIRDPDNHPIQTVMVLP